tara:strand:+ start:208 stop:915 length:708 start_codon:yes stop_codon:yes gene_type:complete
MKKILLIFFLTTLFSCEKKSENKEWIYPFSDENSSNWKAYNGDSLPKKWIITNNSLTFDTEFKLEREYTKGSDIIFSKEEFENFELHIEWKLPKGGNSGIFYHIKEGFEETSEVAPEYQLLDDEGWEELNKAKLRPWQKAGADYAMYSPNTKIKKLYPSGEWNCTKIIFTKKKVEYWLNEQKILTFVPWSEDWYKRKNSGKWKNSKSYGKYKKGYIGLQDHNSSISFRNMKIRKL